MRPIIGQIENDGPADLSSLKPDDVVLKINNSKIYYASDIRSVISAIPNQDVQIDVLRGSNIISFPVKLGAYKDQSGQDMGMLGISFGTNRTLIQAVSKGVFETYNLSIKTLQFIGKMLTGNMGTENLSGPIGIAQMAGNTAQAGFLPFMYLMALLSISLAVLNLLPIPVLDGGQLTLLGIEAVRGKPLPEKVENFIYTGGGVMVLALMIFAIFNDVSRFF
jgi:regulator of sigma E protease